MCLKDLRLRLFSSLGLLLVSWQNVLVLLLGYPQGRDCCGHFKHMFASYYGILQSL